MVGNFFLSKNLTVYEIRWKNYCRARQTADNDIILRMRFECWITKAGDTHSEYVIRTAFQMQLCLRERTSMLGPAYNCLPCSTYCIYVPPNSIK
jgi:hypothetical protein